MSIFKRIILFLFMLAVLSQPLSIGITLISFQANRQYYANVLCINKNRPELACQGKCVLMQKLRNQFDFEQTQTAQTLQNLLDNDLTWILDKGLSLHIRALFSLYYALNASNFTYLELLFRIFESGIFRPPIV